MFKWLAQTSPLERRTLAATSSGWVLDSVDVFVYVYLAPSLMALWHLSSAQSGSIFTAGFVSTSLGGWIAGIVADRYGRVRVLSYTIIWFSLFSVVASFADSYPQFIILRCLQGLGFGGEWTVGAVLIAETIRPLHRSKAVSLMQSGAMIGALIAALLCTIMLSLLPPAMAWRGVFLVCGMGGLMVLFFRRNLQEPSIYLGARKRYTTNVPLSAIFKRPVGKSTLIGSVLLCGAFIQGNAIAFWLPTYVKTAGHMAALGQGMYLVAQNLASFVSIVVAGYLGDVFGRKKTFMVYGMCSFAALLLLVFFAKSGVQIAAMSCVVSAFSFGLFANVGLVLSELFPTRIRATGQGFCYNSGKAAGGASPLAIGFLAAVLPLQHSVLMVAAIGFALLFAGVIFTKETVGESLDDAAPEILGRESDPVQPREVSI
jgi:MFS family permease